MFKRIFIVAVACALAACGRSDQAANEAAESSLAIAWDEWGVPHIDAGSVEAASYGIGWAQMRGRPDLVLTLLGQGRGRAAEYWGEQYFESDALMWTLGGPQMLDAAYEAQTPEAKARLNAFAKGVNDYAAEHGDAISEEAKRVLPVKPTDVLGHMLRAIHITFVTRGDFGALAPPRKDDDEGSDKEETPGSNAWAVAPSRSANGDAMLLANPHLPWSDLFLFFEMHVKTPETDAYGVALIANPFLAIAFNEHLGWTHTVNTYDGADAYVFDVVDGGYRDMDGVKPFDEEKVSLKVRGPEGAMETRDIVTRRTSAGPVFRITDDKAYVMRIAGFEPAHLDLGGQYWAMAEASTLDEFRAAMAQQQMPMFNTIYADDAGNIYYLFNALAPKRKKGDAKLWSGRLDGADPDLRWQGYVQFEKLPQYFNPPSGFLQNSNEPPWTSTLPPVLDPSDYPADFVQPLMRSRPQNGLEMLMGDDSITYEELIDYSQTTRLTLPDSVLPDLIAAAREDGSTLMDRAAATLEAWDRHVDPKSKGAALFFFWLQEAKPGPGFYAAPWSFDHPETWAAGIADKEAAVAALKKAATMMEETYGALDIPWSALARVRRDGVDIPVGVAPGDMGAFRVGWIAPGEDGEFELIGGTTYVAAIEFGETPSARAILPYGNFAARPEGVRSQWEIFADGDLRSVHFTEEEVEAAAVMRETLDPALKR
ncbi:penicillin acylase family protein [Hyphococcus luteus]|nr:penicillin acylase family protein [Marinicaulis flavus]